MQFSVVIFHCNIMLLVFQLSEGNMATFIFTEPHSYASAVLGVVILSVRPSHAWRRHFYKRDERAILLVFCHPTVVGGRRPLPPKMGDQVTHPLQKSLTSTDFRLTNAIFYRFGIRSWASIAWSLCYSWATCKSISENGIKIRWVATKLQAKTSWLFCGPRCMSRLLPFHIWWDIGRKYATCIWYLSEVTALKFHQMLWYQKSRLPRQLCSICCVKTGSVVLTQCQHMTDMQTNAQRTDTSVSCSD